MIEVRLVLVRLLLFGLLLPAHLLRCNDWPQFRGPNRDGIWNETEILDSFPPNGLKIQWKHPVGGGFSSPVVAGDRVFVSDVELIKPVASERVHCFRASTGKVLWVFAYKEKYGEWTYVPERGAGPTATPIVENDRIYVVGASGHTHCLNVRNGKVIWEKNLGQEYEIVEGSCRPSPLIDGSLLILFIGAKPGATVLALDKQTGKEVWKALDESVSSSTPVIISFGGKRQLIVWSNNSITSLDPSNGSIYWRQAISTSGNDSIPTPILKGNRLLVSGLMFELKENPLSATVLWPENFHVPTKRLLSNTSNPFWDGDYIYSARSSGEFVCLEAATGKQLWSTNTITTLRTGASIQITRQGNGYFLFTDEGNLIRAQLSPNGYHEISRFHLIDPTWPFNGAKFVYAPPAFSNGHIFVRSEAEIVCASLEK